MSVQAAFQFIQRLRTDDDLAHQLSQAGCPCRLTHIVHLGTQLGLSFTADDLDIAHKYEWQMRWLSASS